MYYDDYYEWLIIGLALFNYSKTMITIVNIQEKESLQIGFDLWNNFSKKSKKYDEKYIKNMW